jgi:hypothetical protein
MIYLPLRRLLPGYIHPEAEWKTVSLLAGKVLAKFGMGAVSGRLMVPAEMCPLVRLYQWSMLKAMESWPVVALTLV